MQATLDVRAGDLVKCQLGQAHGEELHNLHRRPTRLRFRIAVITDAGETTIPAGLVLANSRPPADVAKNL